VKQAGALFQTEMLIDGVWYSVAGERSTSVKIANEQVDTTDKDSVVVDSGYRSLTPCGTRTGEIGLAGVVSDPNDSKTSFNHLLGASINGTLVHARVSDPGAGIAAEGDYLVSSFERSADHPSAEMWTATFNGQGQLAFISGLGDWVSEFTRVGTWQDGTMWNQGVKPPAGAANVFITPGRVYDNGTLELKQNKMIEVLNGGYFGPTGDYTVKTNVNQVSTNMLLGTLVLLSGSGTIHFRNTTSAILGTIDIHGNGNIAWMNRFGGPTHEALTGHGHLTIYTDDNANNSTVFIYPYFNKIRADGDLFIELLGMSQGSYTNINFDLHIKQELHVPVGVTLRLDGVADPNLYVDATALLKIEGTLQLQDKKYTNISVLCPPSAISGGGTIDAKQGEISFVPPGYDYNGIGTNFVLKAGGIRWSFALSVGAQIYSDVLWHAKKNSIIEGGGGMSPTWHFRKIVVDDIGFGQSLGFRSTTGAGGLTEYEVPILEIFGNDTQKCTLSASAATSACKIHWHAMSCLFNKLIEIQGTANSHVIHQSVNLPARIHTFGVDVLEIPTGVTLTVKGYMDNSYTLIPAGTYAASSLISTTGGGTLVVTG
jgi:predicted secreted protein